MQQKKEKVRIFALARELGIETKDLMTLCHQHGIDAKNQLSTIEPEVREQIVLLVKKGGSQAASTATAPPPPIAPPQQQRVIKNLEGRPRPPASRPDAGKQTAPAPQPGTTTGTDEAPVAIPPTPTTAPAPVLGTLQPPTAPVDSPDATLPVPAPRQEQAPVPSPAPTVAPARPAVPAAVTTPAPAAAPRVPVNTGPPRPPVPAAPITTPAAAAAFAPMEKQVIPAEQTQAAAAHVPAPAPAPKQPEPPVRAPEQTAPPRQAETTRPVGQPAPRPVETRQPVRPSAAQPPAPEQPRTPPTHAARPMRNLGGGPRPSSGPQGGQSGQGGQGSDQRRPPRPTRPGGNIRVAEPPQQPNRQPQKSGPAADQKKGPQPAGGGIRKIGEITPEMMAAFQGRETPPSPKELEEVKARQDREARAPAKPATPGAPVVAPPTTEEEEDDDRKGGARHRPGVVPGRGDRHKDRAERAKTRKTPGEETRGSGKKLTVDMDDHQRHRKNRRDHKVKLPGTVARKGKTPISLPITVRSLSEALGRKWGDVLFKLLAQGAAPTTTINSNVEPEMAELVAIEYGAELEIKRGVDREQELTDAGNLPDNPEDVRPRAPVVVVMGHVDHGKTSLLDRIREQYNILSDVVSTEAGGITQVIRAWRVEKDGHPITFLDTPGHEAFTKMRARGANVTDIAVIVVAANDGVMPQTEEAISHAKAAGVSIVVAINKVDLPDANLARTERQLYTLGVLPDTMGGEVPFVQTSAKSGKGIDELLEQISVVAELAELKANPNRSATGTCLEAYLSEKEGVQATLLVQEGTLKTGDVVLCGASYGSVRRMYDDLGRTIESAGPSVPVRITGLDEVPNADDPFVIVPDLSIAREIAAERKARQQEKALAPPRRAVTLEDLKDAKITELKVILKAEARGSIEAIRTELEKLRHEEVRVRILHTGIGAINVSDVQLALTSPDDTLILGFNVVPDNEAKSLAEERGIQIKEYKIIYQLADDIRSALEGKLKPREDVVHLGRAMVRQVFKISRVGTIAGCSVTQGVIERNAKVRVIRQGVVIYPPAERTVGLESLRRFKEDAREVRAGFECGLKIAGYDDLKVDDVIEAYRIEQVQRTLS